MNYNPIIVALDMENASEASKLVERLGETIDFYKVGLELYTAEGTGFVRELIAAKKQVFLDLKLYDIPETVKRATARVADMGVRFLTVHARGPVMRGAVAGKAGSSLQILGVTVLTSHSEAELEADGYAGGVAGLVERRVRLGCEAGIDGFVCSPLEAARVREWGGANVMIVTPGVRSAGVEKGDQKRVATPGEAIRAGADYLVVGREITRSADPRAVAGGILREVS
jgi:orotidine-5'-phosphate decarboxylase